MGVGAFVRDQVEEVVVRPLEALEQVVADRGRLGRDRTFVRSRCQSRGRLVVRLTGVAWTTASAERQIGAREFAERQAAEAMLDALLARESALRGYSESGGEGFLTRTLSILPGMIGCRPTGVEA